MNTPINIFWFRRDLRLTDNAGLYHALCGQFPVLPIFIFDRNILDRLSNKSDARVQFIHDALSEMQNNLLLQGSGLEIFHDTPEIAFRKLSEKYQINAVYTNNDYEGYARERDESIKNLLKEKNIEFHSFKDHVFFEKDEVLKDDRTPYTVFTPYSKKWKLLFHQNKLINYNSEKHLDNFLKYNSTDLPSMESIGFKKLEIEFPTSKINEDIIEKYSEQRDIPGINGTSKLSVHLRFGTISIRKLIYKANEISEKFLNELIWRDFYQMILWHFPHVNQYKSFKAAYDEINWRHDEKEFEQWCKGNTGYPIVDAGMRELNATGHMHNRVRMIVASFLCKHLCIDWRWGEAYFAEKLLDFDFASNNGGWQWAAGSGCDAAPYFRIFNPYLQTKKFDSNLVYIRKWVPEFESLEYPSPIVDHEFARKRCLELYAAALKK